MLSQCAKWAPIDNSGEVCFSYFPEGMLPRPAQAGVRPGEGESTQALGGDHSTMGGIKPKSGPPSRSLGALELILEASASIAKDGKEVLLGPFYRRAH